jgi:hypothetical protein
VEKLLKTPNRPSVIVALIHELLNAERFAVHADLCEVVKCRCARLRIPYDAGRICAALDIVERTRPLLVVDGPRIAPAPRRDVHTFTVSRREAAELMNLIRQRLARAR